MKLIYERSLVKLNLEYSAPSMVYLSSFAMTIRKLPPEIFPGSGREPAGESNNLRDKTVIWNSFTLKMFKTSSDPLHKQDQAQRLSIFSGYIS